MSHGPYKISSVGYISSAISIKIDLGASSCQSAINSRQPLRQGHHVVDDGVTNIAVEVAQLAFRFAIDRDAERRDTGNLRLAQSFARVFTRIPRVAVIMIVRTAVRQNNQQTRAR